MDRQASYLYTPAVRCGLRYRASSSSAQGVWKGRQVFVEALGGGPGVRIQVAVDLPESFALVPETAFALLTKWMRRRLVSSGSVSISATGDAALVEPVNMTFDLLQLVDDDKCRPLVGTGV